MLSYCLKCKRNTGSINRNVLKTTNGRMNFVNMCYMW